MRAWFEKLAESGNIIAEVWAWLAAQIREILSSKPEPKVDDETLYKKFFDSIWLVEPLPRRVIFSAGSRFAEY